MEYFNKIVSYAIKVLLLSFVFCNYQFILSQETRVLQYDFNNSYDDNKRTTYKELILLSDSLNIDEVFEVINQETNTIVKCHNYTQFAKYLFVRKNYTNSKKALRKANEFLMAEKIDHQELIADHSFYCGKNSAIYNESDHVISSFENAADLYVELKQDSKASLSYMEIANYFSKLGNRNLAEKYYKLSIKWIENTTNLKIRQLVKLNYANELNKNTQFEKALVLYKSILKDTSISNERSARVNNNIGAIYLKQKNYHVAEEYLIKAKHLRLLSNDTLGVFSTTNNLLRIAIEKNDIADAKQYISELDSLSNNKIFLRDKVAYYYNKLEFALNHGNEKEILNRLRLFVDLNDTLANTAFSDKLIEMQKSFELKEKDQEIALLHKDQKLQEAQLKNKNLIITTVGSIALILLAVGYILFIQRKELSQSRKRLLRQREDITRMNEQLRLSNLSKDRILSIIGHDLRGPVGGLKELIELYMELPEYDLNDIEKLLKTAREASTSTYHLLENLLSWANSQRGQIEFRPVATPLAPLIKRSVGLLDKSINTNNQQFEYQIPDKLIVNCDINMLRTIIRNLVSNAMKYSPENGLIKISVVQKGNQFNFCVCDQGDGMTAEETSDIFKKKEKYFIGEENTAKGTGLGLILCKEFVERHGGRIWIESEKGVGTMVCFSIPVSVKNEVILSQGLVAQKN